MIPNDFCEVVLSKSDKETAKIFNISVATVSRWKRKLKISKLKHRIDCLPKTLTGQQQSIVNGLLLGDGYIDKRGRLAHSQTQKRLSYTKFISSALGGFSKSIGIAKKVVGDKVYKSFFVNSCCHDIFRHLRAMWYVRSKKIVPKGLRLNDLTLAVWYADDGCSHIRQKELTLSTNCFSKNDVKFLVDKLNADMGIESTINRKGSNYVIRIRNSCYFRFLEIVKPYVLQFGCFDYKLAGLNRSKSDRICYEQDIISLLQSNKLTKAEIALKLGCCERTVRNWANKLRQL